MSAVTSTQLARLVELRDQILLTGPEHFAMKSYVHIPGTNAWFLDDFLDEAARLLPADTSRWTCGTTACLAGHGAVIMKRHGRTALDAATVARYFGLEEGMFYEDGGLFRDDPQDEWEAVLAKLGDIIKTAEADLAGAS